MSKKITEKINELTKSIKDNTPRVEKTLSRDGSRTPDSGVVSSAAKYHEALRKLAQE